MIEIQELFSLTIEGEGALVGAPVAYICAPLGECERGLAVDHFVPETAHVSSVAEDY